MLSSGADGVPARLTAVRRVQQEAIPMLLSGRDALVKAPTGSGKTLAYLVPMIHDLVVGAGQRMPGDWVVHIHHNGQ